MAWLLAASLAAGFALAALDGKGFSAAGVAGYTLLLAASVAGLLWVGRRGLADPAPRTVLLLAIATLAMRLGFGLLLARGLPAWGYDEKVQRAGYVFWDAFKRDADSWQRGRGDVPLLASFTHPKSSDQYGGLLFLSAGVYRYLSGGVQRPLMIVVLTAAASAFALLFIWGFAHTGLGPAAGRAAAWIALLAPEAVLLGASQMREPFLIAGLAMSLYGYVLVPARGARPGVAWILAGMALLLFFSPPTALAGAAALAILSLWEGRARARLPRWLWWTAVPFALVGLGLAIQSWAHLEELRGSFGSILIQWWQNAGAAWRVGQAAASSDQIEIVLNKIPVVAQLPFLVAYGLVQPFLPAAIAAPGNALWKTIAVWRGLGWFALLPLLVYGSIAAWRRNGWRSLAVYLAFLVWTSAVIASYRAPGYQWDNPRYRTVFLVAQAGLAGWAWASARALRDPWLGRAYVTTALVTAVLLSWYIGRYANLPSLSLEGTLAGALLAAAAYLGACLVWDRRRRRAA